MNHRSRLWTGYALVCVGLCAVPPRSARASQDPGSAASSPSAADEVARLRRELEALREEYGTRMAALEDRLKAIEAAAPSAVPEPPAATSAAPAAPRAATSSSKVFNPDIAVIGDFIGAAGRTPGGGEPSLDLHESELSFQAVVDPYARADFFFTVGAEGAGVEEGYITFPALPGGLLLRAGRMRDTFGKVDSQHNHVLPFIDRPLVSSNLLGGEDALADAGVSVARLIPNPWLFLEATGQVFRGQSEVFKAARRADLAYVGHLRAYQDLSESTNVDLGGSIAYGHNGATPDATTRLLGVDLTLRYRPLRRSIYTHLLARGELVFSRRRAVAAASPPSALPEGAPTASAAPLTALSAVGGYGYLEYQFGRRWIGGLRYDDAERAEDPSLRDRGGSLILTYWPSEFSQIRAQYRHTRFGERRTANELLFQFIYAIGAHGAHPF
jgi:hypothetical protein